MIAATAITAGAHSFLPFCRVCPGAMQNGGHDHHCSLWLLALAHLRP